jgi:signal transduction histidine kinase
MPSSSRSASPWTILPVPDPDVFGDKVYSWRFFFRVNLPISAVLYILFALPPVRAWTGGDPWIVALGGVIQLGAFAAVLLYGYRRVHPGLRELITFGGNLAAAISLPLSSGKPLVILWVLYILLVFFEAYGNPKALIPLLLAVLVPAFSLMGHMNGPSAREKILLATLMAGLGGAVYLLAAYVAGWTREGAMAKAARARESGAQEERARIERSLGGTLTDALSEIALWHEVALAGGVQGAQAASVAKARDRAREALTELRALVAGIDDQPASMSGLAVEIQRRAGRMCDAAGVNFDLRVQNLRKVSLKDAYHVAMAAMEAVENAIAHAAPRTVTVSLSGEPLGVSVEDDGSGFDPATMQPGRGMRNLDELARVLGATLTVDAAPGKGARVRVTRG